MIAALGDESIMERWAFARVGPFPLRVRWVPLPCPSTSIGVSVIGHTGTGKTHCKSVAFGRRPYCVSSECGGGSLEAANLAPTNQSRTVLRRHVHGRTVATTVALPWIPPSNCPFSSGRSDNVGDENANIRERGGDGRGQDWERRHAAIDVSAALLSYLDTYKSKSEICERTST